MIGFVIWSCAQSERVILWCDDNGPLAYARGARAFVGTGPAFPAVGDCVAFEFSTEEARHEAAPEIRHANAVRVVERARFPGVDRMLKEAALAPATRRAPLAPHARPRAHLRLAATG